MLRNQLMTANLKCDSNREPPRFSLQSLLIVVTAMCVFFGCIAWLLPEELPIEDRIMIYVTQGGVFAFAVCMIYHHKRRPWVTPTNYVTVKIDARWKDRVKSPLIMLPVSALTGVSLTFAPAYLLFCGQIAKFGIVQWTTVPLCFLAIYLVPNFYMKLASEVFAELLKSDAPDVI